MASGNATGSRYQAGEPILEGKLYRRIWPHSSYYRDGRVTSQVFDRKRDDHLSMALADLVTPEVLAAQAPTPGFGVAEIDVRDVRSEKLEVIYDPTQTERAHVQVRGDLPASARKRLAMRARVVIPPRIPSAPAIG